MSKRSMDVGVATAWTFAKRDAGTATDRDPGQASSCLGIGGCGERAPFTSKVCLLEKGQGHGGKTDGELAHGELVRREVGQGETARGVVAQGEAIGDPKCDTFTCAFNGLDIARCCDASLIEPQGALTVWLILPFHGAGAAAGLPGLGEG
mmetsp:Transcript_64232/g.139747  ORF Transcript_64232/g.139747 Transcript_64232/m.139747 type:complete len:150 (+) Transcript_64232:1471-1920(+)